MSLFTKVFGTESERELKKIAPIVARVEALEETYKNLSDEELQAKTQLFKDRVAAGETLDDILPEAFATVREASARVLHMRHFPCQIIGGIILHQGRIAEMKTGEGKTLVATLPAYLNALNGKGVHVITVNSYLAERDSDWMGKVYEWLGLTVGLISRGQTREEKQAAYAADITYGSNDEFGFDYLRDNMVIYKEEAVQRGHEYAIVDEVDSILIDEARTPLIISGQAEKSNEMYARANDFVRTLTCRKVKEMQSKEEYGEAEEGYVVDEKNKTVILTNNGIDAAQKFFGIEEYAAPENDELRHYIHQAMKANGTMQKDVDYVVKDGKVVIVDEFTGRLMFGRRFSQGLHQALEAKERVDIENEQRTLATITYQNLFRVYKKLAGMTGTAKTEEAEFSEIYGLDVVEIPPNKPSRRTDNNDCIYLYAKDKYNAVIEEIKVRHAKGQPVLVGTITIENSEMISDLLKKEGIRHNVLNAKNHEKEAAIIAQAGRKGAVTIATNMAGRGTDIILGGNAEYAAKAAMAKEGFEHEDIVQATGFAESDDPDVIRARERFRVLYAELKTQCDAEAKEVCEAGGLCIFGTERHESRRIDNQLRGRAGRQGDPGETRFFISAEDDLIRHFGGDRIQPEMLLPVIPDAYRHECIDLKFFSSAIESAQKKVESANFTRRKHVLEYDDVINQQRQLIYAERRRVLDGENVREHILKMMRDICDETMEGLADDPADWDFDTMKEFPASLLRPEDVEGAHVKKTDLAKLLSERLTRDYERSEQENTPDVMRILEREILLRAVDHYWMDQIDAMEDLKQGVSLRSYGSRDPVVEYKFEGMDMFDDMVRQIKHDTVFKCLYLRLVKNKDALTRKRSAHATFAGTAEQAASEKKKPYVKPKSEKIGPNDPCPCGSGKKYKKCCGDPAKTQGIGKS